MVGAASWLPEVPLAYLVVGFYWIMAFWGALSEELMQDY
jgi:hypothetical protein